MIIASNLKKSFGPQVLFDGVSFLINQGERIGLVGKNGTGKSTLFKMILGKEKYDEGTLSIPKGYRIGWSNIFISHNPQFLGNALKLCQWKNNGTIIRQKSFFLVWVFQNRNSIKTPPFLVEVFKLGSIYVKLYLLIQICFY